VDAGTVARILDLRSDIDHEHACGGTPVNGLLLTAHRRHMKVQLLDLRNSGDTAGSRDRVVGYAAFAVLPADGLQANVGATLVAWARDAISEKFGATPVPPAPTGWLQQPQATFVTLTRQGDLRGCIGSLEPKRPLGLDVRENAVGAAFRDPRFSPLTADEWRHTRVEVSLLSPLEALDPPSEKALQTMLRPGIDGVLIQYGHHRSTFLPQVWEQLPQPAEFLANLRRKAGLPPDLFEPGFKVWRYTVAKWREQP
jgi:AmmeMemoRadiSam system protein A